MRSHSDIIHRALKVNQPETDVNDQDMAAKIRLKAVEELDEEGVKVKVIYGAI